MGVATLVAIVLRVVGAIQYVLRVPLVTSWRLLLSVLPARARVRTVRITAGALLARRITMCWTGSARRVPQNVRHVRMGWGAQHATIPTTTSLMGLHVRDVPPSTITATVAKTGWGVLSADLHLFLTIALAGGVVIALFTATL